MEWYALTRSQIETIIKEGKFDKENHKEDLINICYTVGDALYEYTSNNALPLIKDKNKLYDEIANISLYDDIYSDINNCFAEAIENIVNVIKDKINMGEIV